MAHITFIGLDFLDAQAIAELGRVGPIDDYIRHDQNAELGAFAVMNKGERIGSMALRHEVRPDGKKVLVIVAVFVRETSNRLLDGLRAIKSMARKNGFDFIRAHVYRPRAIKALLKSGYEAVLDFKKPTEYRSTNPAFIANYVANNSDVVMMLKVGK